MNFNGLKKFALMVFCLLPGFAISAEGSLYDFSWLDSDKEIYVLQNRKFRKAGNLFVGGALGQTVSKAYVDGYLAQLRLGYFFKEDWGIELIYSKNDGDFNDLAKRVQQQSAVPYTRIVDSYMAAQIQWAPFYSKINTFNKIFYYDWMFGLGVVSVTDSNNSLEFVGNNRTLTQETNTGLIWSTGLRFYISPNWSVRADFTALRYQADFTVGTVGSPSTEKEWFNNYDLTIGLNYTF